MTWVPALPAVDLDATDTASPACFLSKRSAGMSGLAPITETTPNDDGAARRQAFQEALLMARREALASTARHLRTQSRCKEASVCLTELRAVTHELLAMGER